MAEYKSFHYLMHSLPETIQVHYVSNPIPLTFDELYTPRENNSQNNSNNNNNNSSSSSSSLLLNLLQFEKSFWRIRSTIKFNFYELRLNKLGIITCYNINNNNIYRSIFLNLEILYNEIEFKLKGNRNKLLKKSERKIDNTTISKHIQDYISPRLNITQQLLPWPTFNQDVTTTTPNNNTIIPSDHTEAMCTFDKLSGDEWIDMEIPPPLDTSLFNHIEHLKLFPTLPNNTDSNNSQSTTQDSSNSNTTTTNITTTVAPINSTDSTIQKNIVTPPSTTTSSSTTTTATTTTNHHHHQQQHHNNNTTTIHTKTNNNHNNHNSNNSHHNTKTESVSTTTTTTATTTTITTTNPNQSKLVKVQKPVETNAMQKKQNSGKGKKIVPMG